jgi:3,4-dihydroxy-2-butanone 4-phosphate synthase
MSSSLWLAVSLLRKGGIVLVLDEERQKADLVMASEFATPEAVAFFFGTISTSNLVVC